MIKGKLYVVASPIGNMDDISKRAIDILSKVNIIAAEDTRVTRKILTKYDINTHMQSYHESNEIKKSDYFVGQLLDGNDIAVISDAGMPCLSDPGYRLVNKARKKNINVFSIPGPSSITSALSISGLPTDSFYFCGFLPKKKGRKAKLEFLSQLPTTLVFFEAPYRVVKTLNDIYNVMGDRVVSICREITKRYEENYFGKITEVKASIDMVKIKGEFVIMIAKEGYALGE